MHNQNPRDTPNSFKHYTYDNVLCLGTFDTFE